MNGGGKSDACQKWKSPRFPLGEVLRLRAILTQIRPIHPIRGCRSLAVLGVFEPWW
jgi:hypothetical protein